MQHQNIRFRRYSWIVCLGIENLVGNMQLRVKLFVLHILTFSYFYFLFSLQSIQNQMCHPFIEYLNLYTFQRLFTIEAMFSNTFISFAFFCLRISSLIGLSTGDVHTAFDVSVAIPDNGGCNPTERAAVEAAFTETMEMVGLIITAITNIQAGTETPAVGWIFNTLFGIQASEDLNARGIGRSQEQTDALAKMKS